MLDPHLLKTVIGCQVNFWFSSFQPTYLCGISLYQVLYKNVMFQIIHWVIKHPHDPDSKKFRSLTYPNIRPPIPYPLCVQDFYNAYRYLKMENSIKFNPLFMTLSQWENTDCWAKSSHNTGNVFISHTRHVLSHYHSHSTETSGMSFTLHT